jgi:hypothetical protein
MNKDTDVTPTLTSTLTSVYALYKHKHKRESHEPAEAYTKRAVITYKGERLAPISLMRKLGVLDHPTMPSIKYRSMQTWCYSKRHGFKYEKNNPITDKEIAEFTRKADIYRQLFYDLLNT